MNKLGLFLSPVSNSFQSLNTGINSLTTVILVYTTFKPVLEIVCYVSLGCLLLFILALLYINRLIIKVKSNATLKKKEKAQKITKYRDTKSLFKNLSLLALLFLCLSYGFNCIYQYEVNQVTIAKMEKQQQLAKIQKEYSQIISLHENTLQPLPEILVKANVNDDPICQTALGYLFYGGFNGLTMPDYDKAKEFLIKAADSHKQKNPFAQHLLAFMYRNGQGGERNMEGSMKRLIEAADAGIPEAQTELGQCFFYGRHIGQDVRKAQEYLTQAAEQENRDAQYMLGTLYMINENHKKAYYWIKKAANQQLPMAQNAMGIYYYNKGKYSKSFSLLSAAYAQEKEDYTTLKYLALSYQYGNGIDKNPQKAKEFYNQALKLGPDDEVYYEYSILCLEIGDVANANKFCKLAIEKGNKDAEKLLKKIQTHHAQ